MTARVTAAEVKELVNTSVSDAVILTNHIETANLFVDTHLSTKHTEPMLRRIELYLAAHFVALTEERGGVTRIKMGDADESLAAVYGEGFRSTRFGQTALSLDTTGTLARLAQTKPKAELRIV